MNDNKNVYVYKDFKNEEKTVRELLVYGNKILKEAGIESYILDTKLLLMEVLQRDKLWIIMNSEESVSCENRIKFLNLLDIRKEKMPMAYILKKCEFMGMDFYVKDGVLVPREDTEILVEEVLNRIKEDESLNICDLCCGSGAIGISISNYRKNVLVDLLDIEDVPCEVTKINIKNFGLENRAQFIKSDLLEMPISQNKKYDILVSNPPYIRNEVIHTLMDDVKNFEPFIALSGGDDGLYFYKKIIEQSLNVILKNGILAFEIGYDQGECVKNLMLQSGYIDVKIIKDLKGLDRVVIGILN